LPFSARVVVIDEITGAYGSRIDLMRYLETARTNSGRFVLSDHPLKKLVVAAAAMSETQLVKMRREVGTMSIDANLKELVTTVLDLFIDIGEDPDRRAEAAARCLSAIDEVDSGGQT